MAETGSERQIAAVSYKDMKTQRQSGQLHATMMHQTGNANRHEKALRTKHATRIQHFAYTVAAGATDQAAAIVATY